MNNPRKFFSIRTSPSAEPISIEEIKTFARIDSSFEDAFLTSIIPPIREATETYLGRSLVTQTIDFFIDYFPQCGKIELPRSPVQSVSSVVAINEEGEEETISSENYYVVSESIPGYLVLKSGLSLAIAPRYKYGYKITYTAGYGLSGASVPSAIRNGMLQWCAYIYETRDFQPVPPPEAEGFLNFFRVLNL